MSVLLCIGLLFAGKFFWWVYIQTPVGQRYTRLFVTNASEVARLYDQDLVQLAIHINWTVIKAALLVGIISQAFFLTSRFYDNQDRWERCLFWTAPFVAVYRNYFLPVQGMNGFFSLMMVSAVCALLLHSSMGAVSRVLPDGALIKAIWKLLTECRCLITGCR